MFQVSFSAESKEIILLSFFCLQIRLPGESASL